MMKSNCHKIMLGSLAIFSSLLVGAQKDTTGKGGIDIISSFKPVLRNTAKINFNASPPPADTSKPKLNYDIPNQNLLFGYQPGSLKPLAMNIDSVSRFNNSSYVKAGFGSLRTPYVQLGISLGDGHSAGVNIYAKHVALEGNRDYQNFSSTTIRLSGYFKSGNNLEWNAGLGMKQDKTYNYGYSPATLNFPTDSLRQNFQTIGGRLGFHNIDPTEFGLIYSPEMKVDVFSDDLNNSESNTVLNLPLQKKIGADLTVNLGLSFDLSRVSPKDKPAVNNTMYYISPSVSYKQSGFDLLAGIRPSWDNGHFKMFPNVLANINTPDKRFVFQLGWTGYVRKSSYMYLASQNPWLRIPQQFRNTWIEERFAGFKGSAGDHFTYSAKVGYNKLNDQPLFVNDSSTADGGKSFQVVYEPTMNVVNFGGQVGFTKGEKLSLIAGVDFNQYTGLKQNAEAWGMIPLELKAALRVQIIRDLFLKTDLFAWSGSYYRRKDGAPIKSDGATDLNAGLEFRITKSLDLWAQFNNLFNKQYQRWNQYPVYGFNFVGGIVFSFDQKNQ